MVFIRPAARAALLALIAIPLWSATAGSSGSSGAKNYLDDGVNQYEQERYFEAVDSLRNAIEINPYYGDAYRYLAEVYYALGDYKTSLENSLTALKYAGNDPDAMLVLANSYRELGVYEKAESTYNQIIEKNPGYAEVYRNLAELYLKMNRLPLAFNMLGKADRVNRNSWKNYVSFGKYHVRAGDNARAEEYFKKAYNINPTERQVYTALAEFYRATGNYGQAISVLETGRQLFDNFNSGNLILADCYLASGPSKKENYQKAIDLYKDLLGQIGQKTVRKDRESRAWILYKIALAFETLNRESAVNYYRQAVQADPENDMALDSFEAYAMNQFNVDSPVRRELAAIHLKKAETAFKNGESRNRLLNLKRAVTLYPFQKEARQKLVNLYELAHDSYNAYQELKSLEKIDPSSKVKDKIANYEWDIKNGKLAPIKPELYVYQGLFVAGSDLYNFSSVFSGIFQYYSEYFGKFKFYTMEFRKKQGINAILQFIRNNDCSFFIMADLAESRDSLKLTLYDKTARPIDGIQVNFRLEDMNRTAVSLLEWLDANLPTAWVIGAGDVPNNYLITGGKGNGIRQNETLAAVGWDDDGFQPLSMLKAVKTEEYRSFVTLVSNFGKGQKFDLKDKYAVRSGVLAPKVLAKFKRVLGY